MLTAEHSGLHLLLNTGQIPITVMKDSSRVAGSPVFRVDNHVFTGDPSVNISNRLIPEEPMVCVSQFHLNDGNAHVELLLRFS